MARNITRKIDRLRERFSGGNARFYAFAAFLTLVFFMGGSSRDDVQSLVLLRPLAVLFGAYALTCMDWDAWKGRTFPLFIALALAGLMLLQLIPLPPHVWTALPGRQIFADIADLAGIEQPWRPLTLSPSRTLNSLFSLAIPISAMMLYLNLDEKRRTQAIAVIITLAAISALWAIFQLTGPARSPLYLYNITSHGLAVGLFANRNHQAVILTATIVMLGWNAASRSMTAKQAALKLYSSIAIIFIIVPLIFITGSRAGLILMAPALVTAMILVYFGRHTIESQPSARSDHTRKKLLASRRLTLFSSIFLIVTLAGLSVYFARSLAFDRLFGDDNVEELRSQLVPTLSKMMGDYFPWGSGFGTFEHVYRIYEPQELLKPSYLNQAHNDWLQFPIEGGLPAILIGAAATVWAAIQFLRLTKDWRYSRFTKYTVIMAAMVMLLFLAGSIGDYPLRVPSVIALFAVIACIFTDNMNAVQRNALKART
ncbi:MAG: O-antigen ligase family protein [Parasphingorhabdus sp.]|uniref:O-antigen ligase family protein n=1 Tax=Parasphingorhabdus sp. TaxID=2709688 RepID=UPI003001273C